MFPLWPLLHSPAGMGILKSYKSFGAPLWGPIAYNLMIIIGTHYWGAAWESWAWRLAQWSGR